VAGPRLAWQEATVVAIHDETPTVKTFVLRPPRWPGFRAGQHVDLRLTAPDGYQAERSYSIGSAPEDRETIALTIERMENGEVSPFFHEVVAPGDTIEMRGPIGGHFNWTAADGGPVLLVGGGSGVVPLASILRHRAAAAPQVPAVLLYSARRGEDVIYRDELLHRDRSEPHFHFVLTLTREAGTIPGVRAGRVDAVLAMETLAVFSMEPRHVYVCGSNAFVEAATRLLIDAGVPAGRIRTERYGGAAA
jgi:ferredoxin-NADP reductase